MTVTTPARETVPTSLTPCSLPAVGALTVYPSKPYESGDDTSGVKAFPHCRFHREPVMVFARAHAAEQLSPHAVHHESYAEDQSMVGCLGEANPVQLGGVLDRERIVHQVAAAQLAVHRLAALTGNAQGATALIGNEDAVLAALTDLQLFIGREHGRILDRIATRTAVTA